METTNENNWSTFTHLSTLSQYCIPFGNYIFPILIWSSKKDKSDFIDFNGKQVINFQLSILIYTLVLAMIALPIFIVSFFNIIPLNTIINDTDTVLNNFNLESINGILIVGIIAFLLIIGLKIAEFLLIIYAAVKSSNGERYNYPLTISFIK